MTNEQIKQKAEAYAEKNKHAEVTLNQMAYAAYIAGAHSRDEEISRLGYINGLNTAELVAKDAELQVLRNPWISVEERLPEKIKNKGVSKYVFATWPDGTLGKVYYNYEEYKAPRWEIKGAGITKPAYWMPIPDIY